PLASAEVRHGHVEGGHGTLLARFDISALKIGLNRARFKFYPRRIWKVGGPVASFALTCLLSPATNLPMPLPSSIVILTGAGISVESGIPSFRDKTGIWSRVDWRDYATPDAFA